MNLLTSRSAEKVKTLVENRLDFLSDRAMLSVYDTYERADMVALRSRDVLYCGMITGKKVMHVSNSKPVDFFPHESFVLPAGQEVFIDFPLATENSPTTCIAIDIDKREVDRVLEKVCDKSRLFAKLQEKVDRTYFHTRHDEVTQDVIRKLVRMFVIEDEEYRHELIELGIHYLLTNIAHKESFLYFLTRKTDSEADSTLEEILYFFGIIYTLLLI